MDISPAEFMHVQNYVYEAPKQFWICVDMPNASSLMRQSIQIVLLSLGVIYTWSLKKYSIILRQELHVLANMN